MRDDDDNAGRREKGGFRLLPGYKGAPCLRPCKRVMRVLATNKKNTLMKRSIKEEREGRSERCLAARITKQWWEREDGWLLAGNRDSLTC